MTLKDWLIDQGLMPEESRNESVDVIATALQVQRYLRLRGILSSIDLAAVDMEEKLILVDDDLGGFDATNCDFNGGLRFTGCRFSGDLDFRQAYVHGEFKLVDVTVEGDLFLPGNFGSPDCESDIHNLRVNGRLVGGE
jgi:hypothetical protein